MRGKRKSGDSLRRLILEKLAEMGVLTLDAIFPKKYPWAAISRPLFGLDSYPRASVRTLSSTLSRLKREGLAARSGKIRNSQWSITEDGKRWIQEVAAAEEILPSDGVSRIVIFDIPERERKKRDTLRAELLGCGFEQLQKSVWMGDRPLPASFVELLDDLKLKNKVHIFSVKEHGTLGEEI